MKLKCWDGWAKHAEQEAIEKQAEDLGILNELMPERENDRE